MAKPKPTESSLSDAILAQSQGDIAPDKLEADKRLIKLARKRFTDTTTNWHDIREAAVEDQKFYDGAHYDEAFAHAARARGGNPQIQINQLPTKVAQIENAIRQQNISLTVHATDEAGSEQKAKVLQGIIRHIEHISNAKQAYIWAAGSHGALVPGLGFIKLRTAYCRKQSWDQDIFIDGVKDSFKIIPDFSAQMPDFSDAGFWFEFEEMTKDEYKERYSDSVIATSQWADWRSLGSIIGTSWIREHMCVVSKYWYKEKTIRHFALFEDGTTGYLDSFGVEINAEGEQIVKDPTLFEMFPRVDDNEAAENAELADSKSEDGAPSDQYPITETQIPPQRLANVVKMREEVEEEVHWIITNGLEILDRGEWHDSEFPFVGVCGKDEVIDGKRKIYGIIRHAKAPQKMYNYMTSSVVRKIAASNKTPWIAAAESIPEPQRRNWELSNVEEKAVLYYKATNDQGQPIPAPQRGDTVEPAIQGLLEAAQKFDGDIAKTVGIFEAGMGEALGDRQSGIAIQNLAQKGEQNNFHFSDNLVMSMKRLGILILRLIPKVYDTPRAIRIINPDDSAEVVKINQIFTKNGQQISYNMSSDENYDVVVDTGPSFATKKAEQGESMLKFGAINPQLMPLIADLIAKNMDWDVSGAVAERIVALQGQTMPFLHASDGMDNFPPAAKAAVAQLQGQLGQANQHVQQLAQSYQQEKFKNDTQAVAHQSKERIAIIKSMTDQQLKKLDVMSKLVQSHDRVQLEHLKLQIDHIQHHQMIQLQSLEMQDQAAGSTSPELYKRLLDMINGAAGSPSPSPAQSPTGAPASPPNPLLMGPQGLGSGAA